VNALAPHNPRPRNFPKELPFIFDKSTLRNGTNFTFETNIGDVDLLGKVSGIGNFQEVLADSEIVSLYGFEVRILTLNGLIKAKRAAGRTKDLLVLLELEALLEALSDEEE
jgi:predicted nucleotidyltransferase